MTLSLQIEEPLLRAEAVEINGTKYHYAVLDDMRLADVQRLAVIAEVAPSSNFSEVAEAAVTLLQILLPKLPLELAMALTPEQALAIVAAAPR